MHPVAAPLEDPSTTIAVVGATDSPGKYGGIIYRRMKALGYRVYPVNPRRSTVAGDRAYPDLASLPQPPGIVNFVVPPDVAESVAREAIDLGYTNLWFQPGSERPGLEERLEPLGASVLTDACIMVVGATINRSSVP
ncbi:MAG: CoA-binding protein [Acidimicrobiia bacterium]|nr:CoA-binding protein [Acidimicrobiia bacterium]MDH4307406.1 CoA-binding protein [Acidimicrobiia bacterium]MDH5292498.1 CoA-binding protein [Acidimicrobiia bacterium]